MYKKYILNIHELTELMAICLFILCLGSIFFGYFMKDLFIGFGTNFFSNSIFILPKNIILVESEFIPLFYKQIPLIFSLFGASLAVYINIFFNFTITTHLLRNNFFYKFYKFLNKK